MAAQQQQDLQVQQKREVEKKQEGTIPAREFVPVTDIFETEHDMFRLHGILSTWQGVQRP